MNVNDLRSALREQAATVTDNAPALRVAQVHDRVRLTRHRRVAGVATLTIGVLALVGAVAVVPDGGGGPDNTEPASPSDPAPVPTIQHENFVSHSGEFDLIAAKVGEPGQNTLELTVPAHDGQVHVSIVCYGVTFPDDHLWVSGYVGDHRPDRPHSAWCGADPDTPFVPGVTGHAPGPWTYRHALTLQPEDDQRTVHVQLTQEVGDNGVPLDDPNDIGVHVPVSDPAATLGVAAYTVADPVITLADTRIPPLVGLDGQDYAYQQHRRSEPGERTLTWTLEPSTKERYYDVVFSNVMAPGTSGSRVEASLDGETCRSAYTFTRFRAGGCLMSPGQPHTITVTIAGDPPKNAVLGIVLYTETG